MSYYAVVGEDGWRDATYPPNSSRVVQIAWDDLSTTDKTLGFYAGVDEEPDSGRRYWWTHPALEKHNKDAVAAWREINKEAGK